MCMCTICAYNTKVFGCSSPKALGMFPGAIILLCNLSLCLWSTDSISRRTENRSLEISYYSRGSPVPIWSLATVSTHRVLWYGPLLVAGVSRKWYCKKGLECRTYHTVSCLLPPQQNSHQYGRKFQKLKVPCRDIFSTITNNCSTNTNSDSPSKEIWRRTQETASLIQEN